MTHAQHGPHSVQQAWLEGLSLAENLAIQCRQGGSCLVDSAAPLVADVVQILLHFDRPHFFRRPTQVIEDEVLAVCDVPFDGGNRHSLVQKNFAHAVAQPRGLHCVVGWDSIGIVGAWRKRKAHENLLLSKVYTRSY